MRRTLMAASACAALFAAALSLAAPPKAAPPVKIQHTATTENIRGTELLIKCVITAKNGVYLPTVYYRQEGQQQYYPVPLIPIEGDIYATAVPGLFFRKNLEYYIEARDVKDFTDPARAATAEYPFVVKAVEKKLVDARVAIASEPPGELALDGNAVGNTPWLGVVEPGEHTIVISKDKFKTAQATINVTAGRDLDLRYPLTPAAQPATLAVITDPPGAKITLDGKEIGTSPYISQAPEGAHELVLSKEGFHKIVRPMHFVNDRNAEVSVTLQKLPPEPVLAITTEPAGAILSIDGTDVGKTPFFNVVLPGEHEITLKKEGLRGIGAQIIMPRDRDLDLRYTLDPQPPKPVPPQIAISSDPPGADIIIDGTKVAQTPWLNALSPGEHKVKLSLDGYIPYERKFNMPRDRDTEITLALNKVPPPPGPSKIDISTEPAEAELTIDGKKSGKGSWKGTRNPGEYLVEAKAPGFRSISQKFNVEQGQGVNLKLALTPLPKEASAPLLTIASEPKGATVVVDGKEIGTTPYQGETAPGDHVVALKLAEFKGREEKFKIPADKEFELRVNWTLTPTRRSVTVASAAKKEAPKPPPDATEARKQAAERAAAAVATGQAPVAPQMQCPPEAVKPPPAQEVTSVERKWYRAGAIPWVATGVGLAAVAVGGVFSYQSNQIATQIRTETNANRQVEQSLLDSFQSKHRNSLILYGGGGALAGGVDLYWLLSSAFAKDPQPELVPVVKAQPAPAAEPKATAAALPLPGAAPVADARPAEVKKDEPAPVPASVAAPAPAAAPAKEPAAAPAKAEPKKEEAKPAAAAKPEPKKDEAKPAAPKKEEGKAAAPAKKDGKSDDDLKD